MCFEMSHPNVRIDTHRSPLSPPNANFSGQATKLVTKMADKSITKVSSAYSPKGPAGQRYLAAGLELSMRLWENEDPVEDKPETVREYESIGFVIDGKAELYIEGQRILLEPGDSWVVPKGAKHRYKILARFTAIEATSPPAEVHARDT
jgi:quercetin dioxygenase-like cupin family protein